MIFQLTYTCALTEHIGCKELKQIAMASQSRNLEAGITGILLCKDGSVLQVLEGERDTVKKLYEKIIGDERVLNPLILIQRMSTEREFPNWSMGFRKADPSACSFDLTGSALSDVFSEDVSPEINTIGRTFARVNGLA